MDCPIHGKPGVWIYPCCVGAKGGHAKSAAKRAAAQVNVAKARDAWQIRAAVKRTLRGMEGQ